MNKYTKWIALGVVAIPTLGYFFYPTSAKSPHTMTTPLSQPTVAVASPTPPPETQSSIVIQLDNNAKTVIQKSNELVQKQLDTAISKLTVTSSAPDPARYSVPDMTKTYLTEDDTATEFETPVVNLIDQVRFRGLIRNGQHWIAYLSLADDPAFKVHVGSTFQGIKVIHISKKGIALRGQHQSRLVTGVM